MKGFKRNVIGNAVLATAFCAGTQAWGSTHASDYPTHPLQIIVPSTPGGSVDTLTRVIGKRLSQELKQAVVIVNKPGAGGTIAAEYVQRAAPDGYTFMMGTVASMATNVSLEKNLPYYPPRDFAAVSLVAKQHLVLVTGPKFAAKSVADIIAMAKKHPGKLSFASAGVGSAGHLSGELFKMLAGINLLHVPYKGVSPALIDVINGDVTMTFASTMTALSQVNEGKLHAFAVTSEKRSPTFPNLPTMEEAGVKDFVSTAWYALFAPAHTPPNVVKKISQTVAGIVREDDVKKHLASDGMELVGSTPQELARFDLAEIKKWAAVVKAADLKK
ncbi:Bug family tripartite tricarboxylate transporter substrate binding protein [Candidimonas nitroreducens]|uniref:LacI family transcriptional regulator n=1 Tax=Candidimonas nitroreducens TaxID=683354 RepID=A0A225ML91_9BURK|nr:tripartite tricarboxylate transporter substrate binding protein [Candidimonas nitroreducens]OWT61712.1 hypothetical protein CEY11_07640 [Candidimonas nitroreducens]